MPGPNIIKSKPLNAKMYYRHIYDKKLRMTNDELELRSTVDTDQLKSEHLSRNPNDRGRADVNM